MTEPSPEKRKRGRPPKVTRDFDDTRSELIRSGLAMLTEYGFTASGIDTIVKNVRVPKGSFYHYFRSKEEFGAEVLTAYDAYFCHKLQKHFTNSEFPALKRIELFVEDAKRGITKFEFKRGCLVGNLMQESPLLTEPLNEQLREILNGWQRLLQQCLEVAQQNGQLPKTAKPEQLAQLFWSCWEGAVMRTKLFRSTEPLDQFWQYFYRTIQS